MAIAPQRLGIGIHRHFTTEGVHPYDEVAWARRDARITNFADGSVAFEQPGVEVPAGWSVNATNILAQKYFRGTLGTPGREWSLRQVVDRVVDTITGWGERDGYFVDRSEARAFSDELRHLIVTQRAAFNSPVWFNIGVNGVPQQASACFILSVEDSMRSILNWYTEEGIIFKGGSGAGVNLSRIRSSKELLNGGGTASGPVSFMRGADASAGTIKCLHEDTLIATTDGIRPIKEVQPGTGVATRYGLRTVTEVHDNGVRPLLAVRTSLGDQVRCTPEHRFWARGQGGEGWRRADQLGQGDAILIDLGGGVPGSLQPLRPVSAGHHDEIGQEMPAVLDEPLALWLGWLSGDGSITAGPSADLVAVQVGDGDPDLVDRYRSLVGSIFGDVRVFDSRRGDRPGSPASVGFRSAKVVRFLQANGLVEGQADALAVPTAVASSTAGVRAAFLAGLFEAGGHIADGCPTLSTACGDSARDVHRLLMSIGIPSKVSRIDDRRTAGGSLPVWWVRVLGGEGVRRFAKLVGFVSEAKTRVLQEAMGELAGTAIEGFAEGRELWVTATVESDGQGRVLDLTVEGAHEYLVHGLVTHNSGGKTRRAAKMVILDADHPDVEDFIWCKALEERKARALRDAGFEMDLDGRDSHSIQYQNANNSVRVSDEFMRAVLSDADWPLRAVTTGEVVQTVRAKDLFRQIAKAAWECADPGLQFDTTINRWHTAPVTGRINGSNPCSEYMHLDDSACNLASVNLLAFLGEDGDFDVEGFKAAVELVFTAQEILVGNADYPTDKIAETSRRFRQLGIGYANLGALLMARGLPYDSEEGRAWAGAVTALMTGHAYATSARTAARMGPFAGFHENREPMLEVLRMHRAEVAKVDEELVPPELLSAAQESWDLAVELAEEHGVRNAQASVLAPTGTISFLMDCDTTGIEPDLGLVKTKKLVGGGTMSIVNQTVPRALARLGYGEDEVDAILAYVDEHKSIAGAPHLRPEHLAVFACSMGDNTIHYLGHIRMMAAAQPFLSGAVSKTVNLPEDVTVEDIEQLHVEAWQAGLKSVAVYRDNCKVGQPLAATRSDAGAPPASEAEAHDQELAVKVAELERALLRHTVVVKQPVRERLPRRRRSSTFKFRVADCEGFVHVGEYEDGRPGELFIKVAKQGSTLAGIMDAFGIAISLGLQHGVPLQAFVKQYSNVRFEPAGMTDDPELRLATSLVDYIFRRLAVDYLSVEERTDLGIQTTGERSQPTLPGVEEVATPNVALGDSALAPAERAASALGVGRRVKDAPYCFQCGNVMQRAGACYVCGSCGTTSGCS